MHPRAEELVRHGAADERGGDVVEEAGQDEHEHQHDEGALPVVGQEVRQHHRDSALLEVARQQREPHQEAEQVGEDDPFVLHVRNQARQTGAMLEPDEGELVDDDGGKTGERHPERDVVEERDAEQRQREQNEFEGDAEKLRAFSQGHCLSTECGTGHVQRRERCDERPAERGSRELGNLSGPPPEGTDSSSRAAARQRRPTERTSLYSAILGAPASPRPGSQKSLTR